jgi:hypothetical protein
VTQSDHCAFKGSLPAPPINQIDWNDDEEEGVVETEDDSKPLYQRPQDFNAMGPAKIELDS